MWSNMLTQVLRFFFTLLALPATLFKYIKAWLHFRRLANRFPGPPAYPIIGNLLDIGIRSKGMDIMYAVVEKIISYRTCQLWVGPRRLIFINDPRDVQCYMQNIKNQDKNPVIYQFLAMLAGKGLLTENGERWHRHHKIIAPAFHPEKLKSSFSEFNKHCDIFIECLNKYKDGETIDIKIMIERFAVDNLLGTIMDVNSNEQKNDSGITKLVELGQEAVFHRLLRPRLNPKAIFDSTVRRHVDNLNCGMQKLINKIILERVQILNEGHPLENKSSDESEDDKKYRPGLVDLMLFQKAKGVQITDEDIMAEIQTALVAGFDTVFIAFSFTMYLLAQHPDVQEKVLAELQELFVDELEVTVDMLREMKYFEMVIKECMRIYPPVWFMARVTGEDTPLVSCDLVIPAGANVFISPRCLHYDPDLFPNPDVFDPERFNAENSASRHPYAWLPFAAGKRICIGKKFAMMELKCLVAKIILKYEVKPDPSYEPNLVYAISTYPKNGMRLKFYRR